jgi:hypothetical protein
LIPALVVAPSVRAIDADTRLEALEARLESLTRRVAALEELLNDAPPDQLGAPRQSGEPAWELDDYTGNAPFRVLHRSLDRDTGRVDLLLDVTAPVPDLALWDSIAAGDPVPLVIAIEPGQEIGETPLRLERATRFDPGARVHVSTELPPGQAATVRVMRVSHRDGGP